MQPSPLLLKVSELRHRCFDTPEDSTSRFQFAQRAPAALSAFPPAEGLGMRNVGCIGLGPFGLSPHTLSGMGSSTLGFPPMFLLGSN